MTIFKEMHETRVVVPGWDHRELLRSFPKRSLVVTSSKFLSGSLTLMLHNGHGIGKTKP